jgi:hypothetical protein
MTEHAGTTAATTTAATNRVRVRMRGICRQVLVVIAYGLSVRHSSQLGGGPSVGHVYWSGNLTHNGGSGGP